MWWLSADECCFYRVQMDFVRQFSADVGFLDGQDEICEADSYM